MLTIDNFDFKGKKALVRVDFNVPLDKDLKITDDTRIKASLPTLMKILNDGGSLIIMSHLGRPKGQPVPDMSLGHLIAHLQKELGRAVSFASDCVGEEARQKAADLLPGEVLLLENLRFHSEEEKGDREFAGELAQLGDIYVNDAFGTAHRAHASTAVIAEFFEGNRCFGYVMAAEIENVSKVLNSKEKPTLAIVGGAKVSSKIDILKNLMDRVDVFLIGGGMAYTFIKAQGGDTGASLVEEDKLDLALEILALAKEKNVQFLLPEDSIIANEFSNDAERKECASNEIPNGWMGLDIGPIALKEYTNEILNAKTILWNGPVGVFEMDAFATGTRSLGKVIADATSKGAFSLVGGGDSVAAVKKFGLSDKVSYVSTGGGAMLEYLEGNTLPGIKAIIED